MISIELKYQQVEDLLAHRFSIDPSGRKAFRARLRHVRNLGVPELPKVGSGTQIAYTAEHIHQMFLALELACFGIAPKTACLVVKEYWSDFEQYCNKVYESHFRKQYFIAFNPYFTGAILGPGKEHDFGLWNLGLYTTPQLRERFLGRRYMEGGRLAVIDLTFGLETLWSSLNYVR